MITMILLSDFAITLLKEWQIDDLPVNVLIDDEYYDNNDKFQGYKHIFTDNGDMTH